MQVTAILLAAGKGKRFKSSVSKLLVKLGKRQIIDYSLKVLERHPGVTDIILVVNSRNIKLVATLVKDSGYKKVRGLVLGGVRRQDSAESVGRRLFGPLRLMFLQVLAWYAVGRVTRDEQGRIWIRDGVYGELPTSPAPEDSFPD